MPRAGTRSSSRELHEQVLADGGALRAQPDVPRRGARGHARSRESAARLRRTNRRSAWIECAGRMRVGCGAMTSSRWRYRLLQRRSVRRRRRLRRELGPYAERLAIVPPAADDRALLLLEPSGYARATTGSACLICDCAAVGPDYLPAHAHADTLSFELSLGARRDSRQFGHIASTAPTRNGSASAVRPRTTRSSSMVTTRPRCGADFAWRGGRACVAERPHCAVGAATIEADS